jgi:subtilisin family serine protease
MKTALRCGIFGFLLFFASWAIAANEPDSNCACAADLQGQSSPWTGKIFHSRDILKGFEAGQEKVKVIINLAEPEEIKARTDWHSKQSRKRLQDEIENIRTPVMSAMGADEFKLRYRFDNQAGFSGEVTQKGLEKLKNDPRVISIEPVYILEPHLRQGISLMRADTYRSSYNGAGVAIAICDTGIDYTHPMLGGGGFPNSKVIGGYDCGDNDSDPMPNTQAHGTSCAGIAAGSLGDTGDYIGGVAYNAKLYALKITAGSSGSATSDAMIAAWNWCITHKNDNPAYPILAVSTSFGGGRYTSTCDSVSGATAINNAVAAGITMLASSGNDGYCDSIAWPACYSNMISVGAVYDAGFGPIYPCINSASCATKIADTGCSTGYYASDNTAADKVTSYSNTGSILTLLAPSNQCYTTDIVGAGGYSSGDYNSSFGGTSAACPYAAGAVACLQSAAMAINGSYLTPAEVRAILTSTGDTITDGKVAITKPRINLEQAIADIFGPPIAHDVNVSTSIDTALAITLLAADDGLPNPPGALNTIITSLPGAGSLSDPGAGVITAVSYTLVSHGNQVVYTPAAGFAGIDNFTFKANDGGTAPSGGDSNQATVSITVGQITDQYSVSASYDDTYESRISQNPTTAYMRIGYRTGSILPYYISGMRFTNLSIPSQSQIISAQLEICSYYANLTNTVYGIIQGEDADNAANFSGRTLGGIAKTSAFVNWDHSAAWSADTWYTSPDIGPVIQEVVDRPGWSAGHALVLAYSARIASGGYREFSSYNRGAAYAPKLNITYIGPVTLTTSSTAGGLVTTPGVGSFNYKRGTIANISATPVAGFYFVNWTGSGVTAGKVANPNSVSTAITMDANYTVIANFAVSQMTLTSSSSGNGNVTVPGEGTFQYNYGTIVNLAASPATGFHFVNWTGTGVTAGKVANPNLAAATITMEGNYSVIANFAIDTYTISGHILEPDNETPVEGVLVDASHDGGGADVTDANGLYEFVVPYGWSGTAAPEKEGYTFEPNSIAYSNVVAVEVSDYTATLSTYIISGMILESDWTPIPDVNVVAENDGGPYTSKYGGGRDVTDPNGRYEVIVDYHWSGTVTPSKYAYGFEPNSRLYANVVADQNDGDYAGRMRTFIISGVVRNNCNEPAEGTTVTADNGGGTDITDPNGYYEIWVDYNWSGMVTPGKTDYTFVPADMIYANVFGDSPNQNYLAVYVYDLDRNCFIDLGDLMRFAQNWLAYPAGIGDGDFNLDAAVNLLDFTLFAQHWLEGF